MKLGIKVGPRQESLNDLTLANPAMAEVWFNISQVHAYSSLFEALEKRGIDVGLHFWGAMPDGTMANITYPDPELNKATFSLIEKTIDIAQAHHFQYVNIHPGGLSVIKVDFDAMDYPYVSDPVDPDSAYENFLANAKRLTGYAAKRNIVLTVETVSRRVPKSNWYDPGSRLLPLDLHEVTPDVLLLASKQGIPIANDFAHTATNAPSSDAAAVWSYLYDQTRRFAPVTRLIHLGFLVPPFNGVDNHDLLDNPVLQTDRAIPNEKQMTELLQLFNNRDDVWVLVEPRSEHVKNYFLAQKIVNRALEI